MRKKEAVVKDGKPKRTNEIFQKRQDQIIRKAAKLFMKKGYAQSSMREISKATGIDVGNLYYFIKSKEEILFMVFDMLHRPEIDVFEKQGIMEIDDPVEQLQAAVYGLVDTGYKYKAEGLLLYRESKSLPKRLLKKILERESKVVSYMEEILKRGKKRKLFKVNDVSFTANMIVYQLSLYSLRYWNMRKYTKQELINRMQEHVMKMVAG
jgi:AcrR family transcriptional regulator